jgi:predicted MPP superfamily phosphohydrolase
VTQTSSSRRRFLKFASGAAAAGTLAVGADATIFEPNRPRLVRQQIPLRRLPPAFDGLSILQLSDFHYDPYFSAKPVTAAVRMANDLKPDLIVLTGDFVTSPIFHRQNLIRRSEALIEPCADVLRGLSAPFGVWAVLGNHDVFWEPNQILSALRRAGIQVLRNDAVPIERDGQRFWLSGVGDVLAGHSDLGRALRSTSRDEAVVLLAHEPDFADQATRHNVDLQLSGHSHGGQVRFPLVGAVYLPHLARKYPKGLRQVGQLMLYTNVGIGTLFIPVRWNCPPEVTLITLRSLQPGAK